MGIDALRVGQGQLSWHCCLAHCGWVWTAAPCNLGSPAALLGRDCCTTGAEQAAVAPPPAPGSCEVVLDGGKAAAEAFDPKQRFIFAFHHHGLYPLGERVLQASARQFNIYTTH